MRQRAAGGGESRYTAKAKTTLLKVLPIFRLIDGRTGLVGFAFHLHAKAVEVKSIIGLTTRYVNQLRREGFA